MYMWMHAHTVAVGGHLILGIRAHEASAGTVTQILVRARWRIWLYFC